MHHSHSDDITFGPSGERTATPQRVVDSDTSLHGTHNGGTCVHAGIYTIARGATSNGSVSIQPGARLIIDGTQNGSLEVHASATVAIHGAHNGSVHVQPGGHIRVEPGGKLAGSLEVGGTVENAGARGGSLRRYGDGTVTDLPGAVVKQPEIGSHGEHIYRWG